MFFKDSKCRPCPVGQIQDLYDVTKCYENTCPGQNQVTLPRNPYNCGRCKTCEFPYFVPNQYKTACVKQGVYEWEGGNAHSHNGVVHDHPKGFHDYEGGHGGMSGVHNW